MFSSASRPDNTRLERASPERALVSAMTDSSPIGARVVNLTVEVLSDVSGDISTQVDSGDRAEEDREKIEAEEASGGSTMETGT